MSEHNLLETWQVEVGGLTYEAPFGELPEWIAEGSLQPEDKVRKGNLRWIEARKVPYLMAFFAAKAQGRPMPVIEPPAVQEAESNEAPDILRPEPTAGLPFTAEASVSPQSPKNPDACVNHHDFPKMYICKGCGTGFCKLCPKSFGGTVKLCPLCGALCYPAAEALRARAAAEQVETIGGRFGTADFARAFSHPFKFKASLIFGAVMFALFTVGQSAAALGGIIMAVAAIFCIMAANALTFGVLANTVENFSQGRLAANFMPDFDDFSLWDNVIHPFFLSIGVYIASFGPFVVALLIGFYLVASSVSSHMTAVQSDLEKIPGTHYYDAQRTVQQSDKVKEVLGNVAAKHNQIIEQHQDPASAAVTDAERESREQEKLWTQAAESQKQSLESALGKTAETRTEEKEAMIQGFLNLAAPLVVIGTIFFLWGAFYFPAACAVAGYTRSFTATLNPTVGLDTIRRLGFNYAKILLMGFALIIVTGIFAMIVNAVFSPFDLPGMGNIPAVFVGALFSFYISVVFSCIIGFALFKSADKLALRS